MPDPIDIDALEALANTATPGPWTPHETVQADNFVTAGGGWLTGTIVCGPTYEKRNVQYIAAAHPDVVLALVSEIRKAREAIAACTTVLEYAESDIVRIESEWGSCRGWEALVADGDLGALAVVKANALIAELGS